MEVGFHCSFYQNFYHQTIYAKIEKCVILHHINVKYGIIKVRKLNKLNKHLKCFFWEKSFRNLNINEMVSLFNRTIKNILSNYIPHKAITFDGKIPSWINDNTKQLIQKKNNINKS